MTLGERIKNYRKNVGLSQEGLAEKMNVSRQAITKWENDNGVPDIDNLISLSKVMGISLDELVMGEKESDITYIKKEVADQRNRNSVLYLVAAFCFLIADVAWLISLILNIFNGNEVVAIINGITIILCIFATVVYFSKYIEMKQQ